MHKAPLTEDLVLTCHFTGIYDVNRNNILEDDDFSLVADWAESIAALGMSGVLFHNSLSADTCKKYSGLYIRFVKIEVPLNYSPNVFRYFVYLNFLLNNPGTIKNLFVTDSNDVVALKNPFLEDFYQAHTGYLFCGDEEKVLSDPWMYAHCEHFRIQIPGFVDFEAQFKEEVLLNCGIIGGNIGPMTELIQDLCSFHEMYNQNNKTAYTGDMGAFNYIMRTKFNNRIKHGMPVNTEFKAFDRDNRVCWFRHK